MPIAGRINSCTPRTYFIQMGSLLLTFESLKFCRLSKDKNVFVYKKVPLDPQFKRNFNYALQQNFISFCCYQNPVMPNLRSLEPRLFLFLCPSSQGYNRYSSMKEPKLWVDREQVLLSFQNR